MVTSKHLHLMPTTKAPIGKGEPSPPQSASPLHPHPIRPPPPPPSGKCPGSCWGNLVLPAQSTSLGFFCVRKPDCLWSKEGVWAPQSPLPATCPLVAAPGWGLLHAAPSGPLLAASFWVFSPNQLEPAFLPSCLSLPSILIPSPVAALSPSALTALGWRPRREGVKGPGHICFHLRPRPSSLSQTLHKVGGLVGTSEKLSCISIPASNPWPRCAFLPFPSPSASPPLDFLQNAPAPNLSLLL